MTTFQNFNGYLNTLHTRSGDTHMMYNGARQLGENTFAYAYDALCTEILRFNDDGSVSEWCDATDTDAEYYEPHFNHASVEVWMVSQLAAVAMP